MSENCLLLGAFWSGGSIPNPRHMESFVGEIEIYSDGTFVGTMNDAIGVANITGEVTEGCLQFKKTYTERHPGAGASAKGTLTYIPQRQFRNCGGWHGHYMQDRVANPDGEGWEMAGSAFASICPLSTPPLR